MYIVWFTLYGSEFYVIHFTRVIAKQSERVHVMWQRNNNNKKNLHYSMFFMYIMYNKRLCVWLYITYKYVMCHSKSI